MENQNLFDLHIDDESARYLKEAAKWGRFLSILAFIIIGFYALFIIFFGLIGSASNAAMMDAAYGSSGMAFMASAGGMIFILAILALAIIPVLFQYRFSTRIKVALDNNDQPTMVNAFGNLKSLYKFQGIMAIIWLGLIVLGFIIMLLFVGANIG